ncbi:MAG: helix-turn-helix transcriptional regulator [Clostridia bacterium]|nr:helix-turn-helix transcriptional regulator [Clostridia bacterium]
MNIGNRIKILRKQRGITQEQLANAIGISFQAVSKWENNIALPDITMAPVLANFFGVSMDDLFDFCLQERAEEIKQIVDEAYPFRETDPEKGRQILEEGLKKYPENEILLNNLLYVLNYSKEPDQTIAVASSLIEKCSELDIKYDALRFLAYAYKAKGDVKSAQTAIEQIPEIYFTKLTEMAYLLEGKPKFDAAEKQKWISFENLIQMMWKLAECYEVNGEYGKAIQETEKAIHLISVMEETQAFDNYVVFFKNHVKRWKTLD